MVSLEANVGFNVMEERTLFTVVLLLIEDVMGVLLVRAVFEKVLLKVDFDSFKELFNLDNKSSIFLVPIVEALLFYFFI